MPELAEVEWFRKQWDAGLGDEIVDVRVALTEIRVSRNQHARAPGKSCRQEASKIDNGAENRMLFEFSGDNWLGIHLGMTGKTHVESSEFSPGQTRPSRFVSTEARARLHRFAPARSCPLSSGSDEPGWWKSDAPEIVSPEFDQKFLDQFLGSTS